MKYTLTHERLLHAINYDQQTGMFTARIKRPGVAVGAALGIEMLDGAIRIVLDKRGHRAHRLAWFYVHGEWPKHEIDHINGDPKDNRIANLRDVTHATNTQNIRRARSDSKTGVLGVSVDSHSGRYLAKIQAGGVQRHLGLFDSKDAAAAAYLDAKRRLHEGCTI